MPDDRARPHTTARHLRMDEEDWTALQEAAAADGGRSSVLRRLARLYIRDEGTRVTVAAITDPVAARDPSRPRAR